MQNWASRGEWLQNELRDLEPETKESAFYVHSGFLAKTDFTILVRPKPSLNLNAKDPLLTVLEQAGYSLEGINFKKGSITLSKKLESVPNTAEKTKEEHELAEEAELDEEQELACVETERLLSLCEPFKSKSAFNIPRNVTLQDHKAFAFLRAKAILPETLPADDPLLQALPLKGYKHIETDRGLGALTYSKKHEPD